MAPRFRGTAAARRAWLGVAAAAVVAAGAWGGGCYNPELESNKLVCAPAGKACPDGFQCSGGKCVKVGAVGPGSGGATGSGGTGGAGAGTGGANSGGAPGTGGARLRAEFESCLPRNVGTPDQTDDCDTGLTCLPDCAGVTHCFRGCAADAECPMSSCTRVFPGTAGRFCELTYTTCNPVMNLASCTNSLTCTLLSSEPAPGGGDRTVCECQGGNAGPAQPCSDARDCFPGLVCPPAGSGPGAEFCRRACDPMLGAAACTAGTCRPFGTRWGYCS